MDKELVLKKQRIKEFDLARAFAIIAMVAVHSEFAIYNYETPWFSTLFDYLGSPFVAPIFMFVLGANVFLSSKNSSKELFKRGVSTLGMSLLFNIICHAIPFFILYFINHQSTYLYDAIHWIFAVDILTFAGLAFIFFAFVKKFKINNYILIIIGVFASIINVILVKYFSFDFNNNIILSVITSLFYNSSITGYFSFLSWIIFPIAGYIFIQILTLVKNKDKFYLISGITCLFIYLICIFISYKWLNDLPFIVFSDEYSYYRMHPFNSFGTIAFCIAWLSVMYFVSKIIPHFFDKHIQRLNKNLTKIYIIQWLIINYCFVLTSNNTYFVNEWQFIICFIDVVFISDVLAWLFEKFRKKGIS